MNEIFDIAPYKWDSIFAALFCSTIIGLERQLRGKPVGVRTASLIILGTYLFLSTASMLTGGMVDPSRVVGQVITGIGFLGAGVMLAKDNTVLGVTSAATIWVLAALGVMISYGFLMPAVKLAILVVFILWGVDVLEERTVMFSRGVHSRVQGSLKKDKRSGSKDDPAAG